MVIMASSVISIVYCTWCHHSPGFQFQSQSQKISVLKENKKIKIKIKKRNTKHGNGIWDCISEGSKGLIFYLFLAPNPFLYHVSEWYSNFLNVESTSTIMHHSVGNDNDFFFFNIFTHCNALPPKYVCIDTSDLRPLSHWSLTQPTCRGCAH